MTFLKTLTTTCAALALTTIGAQAAVFSYTASLDGAQQTPSVDTAATGTATLDVNDETGTLTFSLMVSGIDLVNLVDVGPGFGPVHIHEAPAGSAGPVVVPFTFEAGGYTDTVAGFDLFRGMVDFDEITGGGEDIGDFIAELDAGGYYINVHTESFGSGEIRGQLSPVPLPASSLLLLGGLGGLVAMRRRKKA